MFVRMETQNFRELFCARYKCAPEGFETAVLWRCLNRKSLPLARALWRLNPDYFLPDFELIRQVQETTGLDELKSELNDFYYHYPHAGWLRKHMKVRLSGQALTNLAGRLFGESARGRQPDLEPHRQPEWRSPVSAEAKV
jgi:hypothetical protein